MAAPLVGVATALLLAATSLGNRQGPLADCVNACNGIGPSCRQVSCHWSYPLDQSVLQWRLEQDGGPALPSYVPGRTYPMRLSVDDQANPGASIWGFELAPLVGCNTPVAGGDLVSLDDGRTRRFEAFDIVYLSHRCTCANDDPACCGYVPETTPGLIDWPFLWLAPDQGTGNVEFFVAINSANHDGTRDWDRISVGTALVPEDACPPAVTDLRVRKADCDPTAPGSPRIELSWTGGPAAIRATSDIAALADDPFSWPAQPDACLPIDPAPLVFYSVALSCGSGAEGIH